MRRVEQLCYETLEVRLLRQGLACVWRFAYEAWSGVPETGLQMIIGVCQCGPMSLHQVQAMYKSDLSTSCSLMACLIICLID